jgi:hypothetical protein
MAIIMAPYWPHNHYPYSVRLITKITSPGADAHELLEFAVFADGGHGGDAPHGATQALLREQRGTISTPCSTTLY